MSRILVEQHLSDVSSALYGYEYASRALVEDLLLSYASWDGLNGWHGASAVTSGMDNFLDDFGRLSFTSGLGGRIDTVDGVTTSFDSQTTSYGMYGTSNECGSWLTCLGMYSVLSDTNGDATAALQRDIDGWSSTISQPRTTGRTAQSFGTGSLLVRTSAVPAPSAVWLFGSGLLGLVGFAKKKTFQKPPPRIDELS